MIGGPMRNGFSPAMAMGLLSEPEVAQPGVEEESPWYGSRDQAAMMMAALSNGLAGLTLRGRSGMAPINNATFANARKNIKRNQSMDFLAENNPELHKQLMQLPEEVRDLYMGEAFKAMFAEPKDSYSILSGEQKEKLGLPADGSFKINTATGEVSGIGNGGTTINNNMGGGAKPFETKLGEQAAEWYGGRRVTSLENRSEANRVIGDLQNAMKSGQPITGSWASYLPETLRNAVDAEGLDLQQSVERIVQQSLKETLGAQFAQKEAEQLFARTWNPKAPPEVNLRRAQRLLRELDSYAANMDHITKGMLESDGSILRWLGDNPISSGSLSASSIYDIEYEDDFDTAGVASSGPAAKPSWVSQEDWDLLTDEEKADPIWQQ